MKKILLATTMLMGAATMANAQAVTITGEGRMGIRAIDFLGTSVWTQDSRLRLNFNVLVEADHGLTFGAWTRAQMGSVWPGTATLGVFSGSRVWVEASNVRLTFGNADGAVASYGTSHGWLGGCMVGYEGGQICGDAGGLTLVTHQEISGGSSPAQAMISYDAGGYSVAVSHQRGGTTEVAGRASFGAFTVAAGYINTIDAWTVSGHYNGGAWGVGALVADIGPNTNWSLSGTVDVGGGTAYGYIGEVFGFNTYGLSYGYGLGGGAVLTVGAEHLDAGAGITTGSIGVTFTF